MHHKNKAGKEFEGHTELAGSHVRHASRLGSLTVLLFGFSLQHHRINIFGAFKGLFESIYVAKTMEDASTLRLDVKLLESNLMRAHEYEMRVVPVDQRKSKLFYKNTFQPKRMPPIEPARKLLCKQAKGDVKQLFQNIRTLLKTSDT